PRLPCLLLVDANPDHRTILRWHLRRSGAFAFLEASTGEHALALMGREPVDLIIVDILLPRMDGWEMIRRIRALETRVGEVPIIVHTTYITPDTRRLAQDAGCEGYFEKPILNHQEFQALVQRLLVKRHPTL